MPAAQGQGNQSPARGIPVPAKGRRPENTWQPWPLLTESQIEASPSFKLGMTFKAEKKLRDAACSVISDAGSELNLGIMDVATAHMFLLRFFAVKPYQRNDSFIIAAAALLLASKTENKPRALGEIARISWKHWVRVHIKAAKKKQRNIPGSKWKELEDDRKKELESPAVYKQFAEAVTTAERVLLYTTGFQFNVLTGIQAMLTCKGRLQNHPDPQVSQQFSNAALQPIWEFFIQCYKRSRLGLQYDPRTICIACHNILCIHSRRPIPVVDGKHWWYHVAALENWPVAFGEPELVEEVRSQIMMLYKNTAPNGGAAPAPAANANPEIGSQPGTPIFQNGSQTPGASPPPALPQAMPSISGNGLEGRPHSAHTNGSSATFPGGLPPLPSESPPAVAHASLQKNPTAQVKQKQEQADFHFSPSNEFAASPRRPEAGPMAAPDLLQPPEGQALSLSGPLSSQEGDEAKRSRLEKVQRAQFSLKRKAEHNEAAEPALKVQHKSPDTNFGIEFEP